PYPTLFRSRLTEQRLGGGEVAGVGAAESVVAQQQCGVGAGAAQRCLVSVQRLPICLLRLVVAALVIIERGEVLEERTELGMFVPEAFASDVDGLHVQRFRSIEIAGVVRARREIVQRAREARVALAEVRALEFERLTEVLHGSVVRGEVVEEDARVVERPGVKW